MRNEFINKMFIKSIWISICRHAIKYVFIDSHCLINMYNNLFSTIVKNVRINYKCKINTQGV